MERRRKDENSARRGGESYDNLRQWPGRMSPGELSEKSRVDREDSIERYRRAFSKKA